MGTPGNILAEESALWQQCLRELKAELPEQQFNTWIRPLQAVDAEGVLRLLAPIGADQGFGLWVSVSALTTAVTNTMSNGAAVAVLGPIVLKMATIAGESPIIIGFITAVSSAFAYLTVVGTPACTIVYASGYLKTTDFLKVGSRMVLVSIVVMLAAAWIYWPLVGT